MPKQAGRPPGRILFAEGFEALLVSRNLLKSTVATEAGVSATVLSDLLACRCGASDVVVDKLAGALNVAPVVLFPELAGWVGPLPDRNAKRKVAA